MLNGEERWRRRAPRVLPSAGDGSARQAAPCADATPALMEERQRERLSMQMKFSRPVL